MNFPHKVSRPKLVEISKRFLTGNYSIAATVVTLLLANSLASSSLWYSIQCVQSSLAQNGGADLRPHCIKKIQTTLNKWMGRPQLFPEIFKIVLQPIWCDAGSEQPSPPLHRATAAQLLS